MKILVLHAELGILRGGGENFTRNLFVEFSKRGHQVSAAFGVDFDGKYSIPLPACICPIPIRGWWSISPGQSVLSLIGRYIPHHSPLRPGWDRIQDAVSWRTIRWFKSRFQQRVEQEFAGRWNEYDAVYVHGNVLLASQISRRCSTILRLPGPVGSDLEPFLKSIPLVCANGDALRQIRIFLGNHAVELPIGLDDQAFSPAPSLLRSRLGWGPDDLVLGYVGRLFHLKGVDLLAAAYLKLSESLSSVRLVMVGSGEEEAQIHGVLSRHIARGLVHLEHDVDHAELPEWYRLMDVMVMPSRYENFSNSVLEAMSCGVPVLASDIGGNQLIPAIGAGWVFEPGSVSSLAERMGMIASSRNEIKPRGENGRRHVQGHYSWPASAERLEDLLMTRFGKDK
jgi:glycosyltransferase involved in cell wall biosynthesis